MPRRGLFQFPNNVDCKESGKEYVYENITQYCTFLDTCVIFLCRIRIYKWKDKYK